MNNLEGNWIGKISGTNNADVFIEVHQHGDVLSGVARANDMMYGISVYNFTGNVNGCEVVLNMKPDKETLQKVHSASVYINNRPINIQVPTDSHGLVTTTGKIQENGSIAGKWTSSIGTGGTFSMWRETAVPVCENAKERYGASNRAFVMMSISPDNHELEDVLSAIRRATISYQIKCVRVDEVEHTGKVTDLILEYIRNSKFLICDISTERPNVYYELGYAHGLGRKVILIARKDSNVHFDIKDYNIIFYQNMTDLESKLSKRIESSGVQRITS